MPPPPSPTSVHTFALAEKSMRYGETYVTSGINRKFFGVVPRGIYRGFELAPTGVAYQVQVLADTEALDSLAVYETASGYSLTVRRAGDFTVTLSSLYESSTVVLALYASYTEGATTTFEVRAYTEAQFLVATERSELIVLGIFAVPAGGIVLTANLTGAGRMSAWQDRLQAWPQVVRDWSFSRRNTAWAPFVGSLAGTTNATHLLTDQAVALGWTYPGYAAAFLATQILNQTVHPSKRLRWSVRLKVVVAITAGTVAIRFGWKDSGGVDVGTTTVSIAASTVDATTRTVDGYVNPLAGSARLWSVELVGTGLTAASAALALVVNTVEVFAEPLMGSAEPDMDAGLVTVTDLAVRPADGIDSANAVHQRYAAADATNSFADAGLGFERGAGVSAPIRAKRGFFDDTSEDTSLSRSRLRLGVWPDGEAYTLLIDTSGFDAALKGGRLYYVAGTPGAEGALVFTVNARRRDDLTWEKDVAGELAAQYRFGDGGFSVGTRAAASGGTWATFTSQADLTPTLATLQRVLDLGVGMNQTTDAIVPRAKLRYTDAVVARTLMLEMGSCRIYAVHGADPAPAVLELTVNAVWSESGATWSPDVAGNIRLKARIGTSTGAFTMFWHAADAGALADATWTEGAKLHVASTPRLEVLNGILKFTGSGAGVLTQTNPASTAAIELNALYALAIPKAWGVIVTDGAGGVTVREGMNITSVAFSGVDVVVTFAVPPSDSSDRIGVLCSMMWSNTDTIVMHYITALNGTTASFKLFRAGAALDPTAAPVVFYFEVKARSNN